MSNLTVRLLTAIVAVPLLIYLLLKGGVPFAILVGSASIIGLYEFFAMMEARGYKPNKTASYILAGLFGLAAYIGDEYVYTVIVTFSVLIVLIVQLAKKDVTASIGGMAVTAFGLLYVPWLLSHAVLLRNLGDVLVSDYSHLARFQKFVTTPESAALFAENLSLFFMFVTFASTFGNDTGAYFAGRFFGKHKMAPTVSPKKTWEGFVGGVLTAMAVACLVKWIFDTYVPGGNLVRFTYWGCLILGGFIGAIGAVGDLVESLIKRDADIKDSGWIIPGHGGILDRVDALLFTFPLTYYVAKMHYVVRFGGLPWE